MGSQNLNFALIPIILPKIVLLATNFALLDKNCPTKRRFADSSKLRTQALPSSVMTPLVNRERWKAAEMAAWVEARGMLA